MSIFSKMPSKRLKKNSFDLSFDNKLTMNFGDLVPCLVQECLPGDTFAHSHELFAQFAPLVSNLNQRFDIKVQYFFCPNRILYENWPKFLSGGDDGLETLVPPYVHLNALYINNPEAPPHGVNSLLDYMGMPSLEANGSFPVFTSNMKINTLPFRAYQKIYNDWYRDENLIPELDIPTAGGEELNADLAMLFTLRKRSYYKDYFTGALPFPQKGPSVLLPLGDSAQVYWAHDEPPGTWSADTNLKLYNKNLGAEEIDPDTHLKGIRFKDGLYGDENAEIVDEDLVLDNKGEQFRDAAGKEVWLAADLRNATAATIEDMRLAMVVQEWLETNARGGTRYVEQIFAHFGKRIPDYKIQRPEYLGGSSQPVVIGNIYSTNTSDPDSGNVQAQSVSKANSSGISNRWKYTCDEHGWIIGIMSVQPRAAYFQGVPRKYSQRMDKFDYYWPEFAHLGEQQVMQSEIFLDANNKDNDVLFGYVPRYAEYKINLDEVHGEFRTSLATFHDARKFNAAPVLNKDFIEINPTYNNLNRIFNYMLNDSTHIWVDIYHHLKALRPMPYYGLPKI